MKNIKTLTIIQTFCIVCNLLIAKSVTAQVSAFHNDKPAASFTTSCSQVITTWDGTAFFNQWDMEGALWK